MAWLSAMLRLTKFGASLDARIATSYTEELPILTLVTLIHSSALNATPNSFLAWHLGERGMQDTEAFTEKLHEATNGHFQLTTDGYRPYEAAVSYSLGTRVDYAMLIKVYGNNDVEGERKYSPPEVVDTTSKVLIGNPDPRRICTSIVERSNLSIRTSVRRLTRLTNAFSKKWEHLRAMLAVYFAFYNFCRINSSIRYTPAMESGLTKHVWSLRELLAA
jgi:IS1 family transposase